jgi:hypothetical protein
VEEVVAVDAEVVDAEVVDAEVVDAEGVVVDNRSKLIIGNRRKC